MSACNRLRHLVTMLLAVSLVSCTTGQGPSSSPTPAMYTDPFAYCTAVGTIDSPDARYTGTKAPDAIVKAMQQALNTPDLPADVLTNGLFWRCMDGKVYGCFVGANLPCQSKANLDRTPTQAVLDYCTQNPNVDFIPAVVTGRETVYEWRCANGAPEIASQVAQADAAGFIAGIWYELAPQ